MTDDSPYTKREQDNFHDELMKRMDKQDKSLQRIEEQFPLFKERVDKHDWWIRVFYWALGIILAALVAGFPFLRWAIQQDIANATNQAVNDAFNTRFSKVEVINNSN